MELDENLALGRLFNDDVECALGYCEALLSHNYKSFSEFHRVQSISSTCQKTWSKETLSVYCKECSNDTESFICLPCFFAGNHEGHHVSLKVTKSGSCCCGDPITWKTEGFCMNHKAAVPQIPDYKSIEPQLVAEIALKALDNINFLAKYNPDYCETILKWIRKNLCQKYEFRRCVSIAITNQAVLTELLQNIDVYTDKVIDAITKFLTSLLGDPRFLGFFVSTVYDLQDEYTDMIIRSVRNDLPINSFLKIINVTKYAYKPAIIKAISAVSGVDWTDPVLQFLRKIINLQIQQPKDILPKYLKALWPLATENLMLVESALRFNISPEKSQSFFNELIKLLSQVEGNRPFMNQTPSEDEDFASINYFNSFTSQFIYSFYYTSGIDPTALVSYLVLYLRTFFENDRYDCTHDRVIFERSIIKDALFTMIFPLHLLLATVFYQYKDKLGTLLQLFRSIGIVPDSALFMYLSILPIRYYAACNMSMCRLMPVISRGVHFIINFHYTGNQLINTHIPIFAFIQNCFGMISHKDKFISMIACAFGLTEPVEKPLMKNQVFSFFFFIICLFTEKLCFNHDIEGIGKQILTSLLFGKPKSVEHIAKTIPPLCLEAMDLDKELHEQANCIKTNKLNYYKLKNEKSYHPFFPWITVSQAMNQMELYQQKFQDSLPYFPDIRESIEGIEFKSALKAPTLIALIVHYMISFNSDVELMNNELTYMLINLLIKISKEFTEEQEYKEETIVATSFKNLCDQVSQLTCFKQIILNTFELQYLKLEPIKLRDIISQNGSVGQNILFELNIEFQHEIKDNDTAKEESHQKALRYKKQISQEYKDRQESFALSEQDTEDDDSVCTVCNLGGTLCYPALAFFTTLPFGLPQDAQDIVSCYYLCPHLVHDSCVQITNNSFRCPVDRLIKSTLLPKFDCGYQTPSEEMQTLIRNFRKNVTTANLKKNINAFEQIANSLIGSYVLADMRLRSLPGCLDSKSNSFLFLNLFLLLWHLQHMEQLTFTSDCATWTAFKYFIADMVVDDDPLANFNANVMRIVSAVSGEQLFEYLRLVTLFEHFSLDTGHDSFVDWDEVLEFPQLAEKYNINVENIIEINLKPFSLISLPKNFLDFAQSPYNFPIDDLHTNQALCLLTGQIVSMKQDKTDFTDLLKHLENNCHWNATYVLHISGPDSTALSIASQQFNSIRNIPSIYLDSFGDEDIGFRRGQVLYLNDERLEHYIELLLSGEWTTLINRD